MKGGGVILTSSISAFSPIADPKREFVSKTTVKDIMRTIMQPSSMMVS